METYIAEFGGPSCPLRHLRANLEYEHGPEAWQPLDRVYELELPESSAQGIRLVFPAFYRASQHFAGIGLPPGQAGCLAGIKRIEDPDFPFRPLFLVLDPDWRSAPAYQTWSFQ
jgi:hypothetical protein